MFAYGLSGDKPVVGDYDAPPPPPDPCAFNNQRVITYNPNSWTTLLDAFAANQTHCVQYYITLPAVLDNAGLKTMPRDGSAGHTTASAAQTRTR